MEKLANNRRYLTLLLVALLCIVIGTSLSYVLFDLSSNDNVIQTGKVTMSYIEPSNTVVLKDALPKKDEVGKSQIEYFEFFVISDVTTNEDDDKGVDMQYEISLSETDIDTLFKPLASTQVKVYLTEVVGEEEIVVLEPTLIKDLEKSIYHNSSFKIFETINHHHNNNGKISTKYRLRFWIDFDVDATNWEKYHEFEYRFVVNVNGHAEKSNTTRLSQAIKNMYTVDNKAANIENGTYYLQGPESQQTLSEGQQVLYYMGFLGNLYIYRNEDGTYNDDLLEQDIKSYFITEAGISKEEYEAVIAPFGGYLNFIIGGFSGIIDMDEMTYIEGYDQDDIPTLEEAMQDENLKTTLVEFFGEIMSEVLPSAEKSFLKMYQENNSIKENLLNENLELGLETLEMGDYINLFKTNFGSLQNCVIAESLQMVDESTMTLLEGYTIDDIPKLFDLLSANKEEIVAITNNYVKLNNILYEVISINKDNSINLIEEQSEYTYSYNNNILDIETYLLFKYYGIVKDENFGFSKIIKNTTLNSIIVDNDNKYLIYDKNNNLLEEKTINGYARYISRKELEKTYNRASYIGYDFYLPFNEFIKENEELKLANSYIREEYTYSDIINNISYTSSATMAKPVITIRDIIVKGDGSKTNPFYIEKEKTLKNEQIAINFKDFYQAMTKPGSGYVSSFDNETRYINLVDKSKSKYIVSEKDEVSTVAVKIGNSCYYAYYDDTVIKKEPINGDCPLGPLANITKQPISLKTYEMNETVFSITADNVTSYQWQQFINGKWIDLEDLTGRITGSKTNTLTIYPTDIFHEETQFRCLAINETGARRSNIAIMDLTLSDGEWEYKEIGDTNKYRIINYVGNPENSQYFTSNKEDNAMYDMVFPTVINGNLITQIESVGVNYNSGRVEENCTWVDFYKKIVSIEFPKEIKEIKNMIPSENAKKLILHEGLEKIGGYAFDRSKIEYMKLPTTLNYIGIYAFSSYQGKELEIPSNVKEISHSAFSGANKLEKLILHEGLEEISHSAFSSSKITSLTLPSTVKKIGERAFEFANILNLNLNKNLESIGAGAFYSSEITKLTLPNSLTKIDLYAFRSAKLTELVMPDNIEIIEPGAFKKSELTKLVLPKKLKIINGSYTDIWGTTIVGAFESAKLTELEIPEGVKYIGENSFKNSILTELEIPGSVETIETSAFYNSPLTSLKLHEGIKSIGSTAFYNSKLKTLELPNSLITLKYSAFYNSPLTSLKLSENLEFISVSAFYSSKLTNLEISSSIHTIEENAFYNSPLTSLKLNNKLVTIEDGAFYNSNLTSLELNEGLNKIGIDAFHNSKIESLEIPASLKTIDIRAFYKSPLTSLKLSEGLENISDQAFYYSNLKEISIPSSVKRLGSGAFYTSRPQKVKIYGKRSSSDFSLYGTNAIIMDEGYEIEYIPGTLE